LRLKRKKNKFSPVYKKSFTIQFNKYPAYKSVAVGRINEEIKIDKGLKNENKKIEKKVEQILL